KGHLRHNHPGSEEVLYYVSGEGRQMVEDDDGTPMYRDVRAGDAAYIPAGVYHGTENTGWEPMRLIAIYNPGGPEAILRDMPECTTFPPGVIATRPSSGRARCSTPAAAGTSGSGSRATSGRPGRKSTRRGRSTSTRARTANTLTPLS